jgi:NAD(P)-dependent dehydrogenase (short-subunit alcohol dehydrogenase family)
VGKGNKPEVVVVTGASAGVGRATAQAFAKRGARVGLLARGRGGLEGAKTEVESLGGKALALPTDVSDADAVEEAARRVEEELGPIDVWVNDAMVSVFSPAKEMKPEEYRRVTEVSYLGTVYGTLAALKWMLPRNKGHIVQVGSALAYRAIPLQSAYCGSKHAIQGFTESVRSELIHDRSDVKVTMVQLPAVNTPQFGWVKSRLPRDPQPVPPIFQPEVPAEAIYWAAHHDRNELWLAWPAVKAILGNKVIPRELDYFLAWTGYNSQQTDEIVSPERKDNLWKPVDDEEDRGAHGSFDGRAIPRSYQWWANTHRGGLALAGAGLVALAGATLFRR